MSSAALLGGAASSHFVEIRAQSPRAWSTDVELGVEEHSNTRSSVLLRLKHAKVDISYSVPHILDAMLALHKR